MKPRNPPRLHRFRTSLPDNGQATVEFALVLPMVIASLLLMVQVLLVVLSQLSLQHEARIAVRAAAIATDPTSAARAAVRNNDPQSPSSIIVETTEGVVTVFLTRQVPIAVPILGRLWPDIEISVDLTMALEPPLQPVTLS